MPPDDRSTAAAEPVLECAPLAREAAARLCRVDPATGERCAWYHGLWLYLRALGLITTPAHHSAFLREGLAIATAGNARPQILVSGAADFSILAHVLAACRERGASPEITVLDICETPLHLNRWYAARIPWRIRTVRSDILDYESPDTYDVVCTHSFFGRFTDNGRKRLMSSWRRLLKPGGIAIASNRVRAGAGDDRLGFSPEQALAFTANVVRKAEGMRGDLDLGPAALGRMAEIYAARHQVHPVHSVDEIREMFEGGGLRVQELKAIAVSKAVDKSVGGPTTLEGARYACVIARKA